MLVKISENSEKFEEECKSHLSFYAQIAAVNFGIIAS